MTTLAFHGDFASGEMLREDAGNPDFIDEYPDWTRKDRRNISGMSKMIGLACESPVVLIGYSRGGQIAARIAAVNRRIKGLVLYEAPLTTSDIAALPRRVAVTYIRSIVRSTLPWRNRRKAKIIEGLRELPDFTLMDSSLPHVHKLRHGWDQNLNGDIATWLRERWK